MYHMHGPTSLAERYSPYAVLEVLTPRTDIVYVEKNLVKYCQTAKIPLLRYCKSIEPALVADGSTQLIPYDPSNPNHVNDIMNGGTVLIGKPDDSLVDMRGVMGLTAANVDSHIDKSPMVDVRKAFGVESKFDKGMVSALSAAGVDVGDLGIDHDDIRFSSETPRGMEFTFVMTPPKKSPQKQARQKAAFNALINAFGGGNAYSD